MNYLLNASATAFGIKHIFILLISLVLIFLLTIFLKKISLKKWVNVLFYVGIISEVTKVISYIVSNEGLYNGYLPKTDLPLQLCSIQLIFIAILKFSNNEKFKRTILSFMMPTCLLGGVFAILLPTYSALNNYVITFQYFGYHIGIASFAIYLLFSKTIQWTIKDYLTSLKFLAFMGLIAIYFNSMFYDIVEYKVIDGQKVVEYVNRVNFMYVVDAPVSGLPFLNKSHGWLVYLSHYACLAITLISLCYIKPIIKQIKNK